MTKEQPTMREKFDRIHRESRIVLIFLLVLLFIWFGFAAAIILAVDASIHQQ